MDLLHWSKYTKAMIIPGLQQNFATSENPSLNASFHKSREIQSDSL